MRKLMLVLTLLLAISGKSVFGQISETEPQAPSSSQGLDSSITAVRSITGCVIRGDHGFSLITESGAYLIETEKNLSQYVNKQLKITAILENRTDEAPSGDNAEVIRDLRLRMFATVIGDCIQP